MNSNLHKKLDNAAEFLTARMHIAIGGALLLVVVFCLAMTFGLINNGHGAVMAARGKTCEEIAVFGSEFVQRNDLPALDDALRTMADRNLDILSATLRRADGKNLMQIGNRVDTGSSTAAGADAEFEAPVFVDDKRWGQIEVRFRSAEDAGGLVSLFSSPAQLIATVALAAVAGFLFFAWKKRTKLDPSKVIPVRIRSALDNLNEGLLVVDNGGRIVLANQAFAKMVGCESDEMLGARASQFNWIIEPGGSGEFPWTRALRERKSLRDIPMRLTDANSNPHTLTVNSSPLLGEDGEYRGVVNSFGDITMPEKKEVTRRKQKSAADTSELLAANANPSPIQAERPAARAAAANSRTAARQSTAAKSATTVLAAKPALPKPNTESYDILFDFVDRLQAELGAVQEACKHHDLSELASLTQLVKASHAASGSGITVTASKRNATTLKKKTDAKAGSIQKRRPAAKAKQAGAQSPPPLLSSAEVREAFAACPDRFPPILSLAQASKMARLTPAALTRQVKEGKFQNCASAGTPPLFWRDRFISQLFNAEGAKQ